MKQKLKKCLNALGFEVKKFHPESSDLALLIKSLDYFDIDLIVDVGANEGQFSQSIRAGGYRGTIVSIEPLSSAHEILTRNSKRDPLWKVLPRCAAGESEHETAINISSNSVSSSILAMLEAHKSAAPDSKFTAIESVKVCKLDDLLLPYIKGHKNIFVKIDTQGYEWQVLNGLEHTFKKVRGVQVELSMLPLYEGQHLWVECISRLELEGLTLWGLQPAFVNLENGRTLQFDGLFFRE